ncbi:MAG TPA: thiamine pyrophosphate-dependent enzyme [Rudaea sp.]
MTHREPTQGQTIHSTRRDFVAAATAVGAGVAAASMLHGASAQAGPGTAHVSPQPDPAPGSDATTADILVDALIAWGAPYVFGVVGDGINSIVEALRKRQDKIRYIAARHEEAAAFMACGVAKHTGKLGVCLGTTGPGAVHLLNGLYDAQFDSAPVLAITGTTFHDLIGTRFMQSVDTKALMKDVALYNVEITGPNHALIVANRACRAALGHRGVAHVTVAKDVQMMKLSADKPSSENHGARTSSSWLPVADAPDAEQLRTAAGLLNAGQRVAIMVGQGALGARAEVTQLADTLAAPVAKALLGKAVLPDDSPFTTGGTGHLGTLPSDWAMHHCDTVLLLGTTMPWIDSYPKPGQARGVQVDINPDRIGLRYPVEIGLVGDVRTTLRALLPMLQKKADRSFLTQAQEKMREWNALLDAVENTARSPLRPQMVMRALSDLLADDAVVSLDCGANTQFSARHIRLRERQKLTGTGMLATMAPGLSYAIAAQLCYPERQSIAVVGDGGFAQLMGELSTAVKYELPVKIILLKNNSLAEVKFEQIDLGNPEFGCDLPPIDFAAFAQACGAEGYRCDRPENLRETLQRALASKRPALIEASVDPNEKPTKPDQLKA